METLFKVIFVTFGLLVAFGIYDNIKHPCNTAIMPSRAEAIQRCLDTPNCRIDSRELRQLDNYKAVCKND